MFNIKIKKTSLIVANKEPLASGASKIYHVSFDFDEEWDGLLKNVIFKAGETSVAVLLEGNSCQIPWEVLSSENIGEKLWIGVYGSDTEGTKLPTIWNELEVIQAGAELCGSGSEPTPTAVSLIYDVAKNAEKTAKDAIDEASKTGLYSDMAEKSKEAAEAAAKEANSALASARVEVRLAWDEAERAKEQANLAAESAEIAKANTADIKKQCANAIRGRLFGASVSADDISPIEHELDLKVISKNILPKDYIGRTLSNNGITAVINSDGGVTANGTANSKSFISLTPYKDWFITEETAMFSGSPQGLGLGLDTTARMILETVQPDGSVAHNGSPTETTPSYVNGVIPKGSIVKRVYLSTAAGYTLDNVTFYPQLEYGTAITEFSSPSVDIEGVNVTVSDGENTQTGTADADGNVSGLISFSPNMTLTTDNAGAVIECAYNRDTNKVIEELTNAIISLGGNI